MRENEGTKQSKLESSQAFRDRIATVDEKGKRKWIFAKKPKGKFYNIRTYTSWFFFILFVTVPFLKINGRPFLQFNIPDSKFIIFGKIFWPQDFFIFGLGMVTFIVFIILFTSAFGRLFCGWVCPQTIFMEMFFRKIEYFIEGDAPAQRMLAKAPWNREKIFKKTTKHVLFFLLSFFIANLFLSYIIGIEELYRIITAPVSENLGGFFAILIFSGVFYGVFAFFREQVCTVVCPYGRLQGVLMDKNSMIVAYDYQRGETRAKYRKEKAADVGDCIDCFQCVDVCPTGIDIRNGTQMECVGCTACIDACNNIMEKVNRPLNLIRYASENGIKENKPLKFTGRMKFYTVVLVILSSLLGVLLATRKDVDATVMRTPGMLFQKRGEDSISNLYNIKIVNKGYTDIPLDIRLRDGNGKIEIIGGHAIYVPNEGQGSGSFFIILPRKDINRRKLEVELELYNGEEKINDIKTNFLGPVAN